MPYVSQVRRKEIAAGSLPRCGGDLNYLFTQLAINYIWTQGASYAVFNEVIGALECCKLELYRRRIAGYEDSKIKQNGDVYDA